jgi:hypothetical protein
LNILILIFIYIVNYVDKEKGGIHPPFIANHFKNYYPVTIEPSVLATAAPTPPPSGV